MNERFGNYETPKDKSVNSSKKTSRTNAHTYGGHGYGYTLGLHRSPTSLPLV